MTDNRKEVQPVLVPLLNPNEPEARLVALQITEGQLVAKGDLLCTLETTKSVADVTAEASGYIIGLHYPVGTIVHAGELFCYLSESAAWRPPQPITSLAGEVETGKPIAGLPQGLRITQPALELAQKHNVAISDLPIGPLVTEVAIRKMVVAKTQLVFPLAESQLDPTAILVYGGGGHGKSLIDLLRALGAYQLIGVIDDSLPTGSPVLGVPVLCGGDALPELYEKGIHMAANAVGGIGDIRSRIKVFEQLASAGFSCPTLVHPTAYVEPSAQLSAGVQVMPHAYIGSEARIGFGVLINTSAIVSHDCQIGDYANLSPGAILAGGVIVGAGALVGMGVTINLQVVIGEGARIGNGATVKGDVPARCMVHAGSTWPA